MITYYKNDLSERYIFHNLPCFHECFIITSVVFQLLFIDMDNISANAIKEILRVRNYNENPFIRLEFFFQPYASIEIEMIGWFVEQQQMRFYI